MDALTTLFVFNTAVILVNAILAGICLYYYKDRLYRLALYIWIACIFNNGLQAVAQSTRLEMILSFSTYFACSYLMVKILADSTGLTFAFRRYWLGMIAGVCTSILLETLGQVPFLWMALPTAMGVAYPMMDSAIRTLFSSRLPAASTIGLSRVYAGILAINGLHFLDYPFLRSDPSCTLLGLSFALVILVAHSVLLPSLITMNIANRYAGHLEDEVERRTSELKSANTNLTHFTGENKYLLSVVCHDIAGPLATIMMSLDIMDEERIIPATGDAAVLFARIRKLTGTIEEILTHVRDLQAVREGKARVELKPVDLHEVVQKVAAQHSETASKKNIEIVTENSSSGDAIWADTVSLKNQVVNNLVSNAIKFSHPNTQVRVRIKDQGEYIEFSVIDSGIGIPKEISEQIFNPSSATNRKGTAGEKGTGFGLPIVKACLDRFGAQIRCESRTELDDPNAHGTSFIVLFKKASAQTGVEKKTA